MVGKYEKAFVLYKYTIMFINLKNVVCIVNSMQFINTMVLNVSWCVSRSILWCPVHVSACIKCTWCLLNAEATVKSQDTAGMSCPKWLKFATPFTFNWFYIVVHSHKLHDIVQISCYMFTFSYRIPYRVTKQLKKPGLTMDVSFATESQQPLLIMLHWCIMYWILTHERSELP